MTDLISRVMASEGFSATVYKDTMGHPTIGYGMNLDAGITRYCAGALLEAQLSEARSEIKDFPWFLACDPVRQDVLTELCFNMGLAKLQGFHLMLAALANKDWPTAGMQLQASAWFGEVGTRGPPLVELLTNGG